MAIQPISSNFAAANSEHVNPSNKTKQDSVSPQVYQDHRTQNTDQIHKTDITSRIEHVYDNKGKLLLKFMDSHGNVVFQSPSETTIKMESQKNDSHET